MINSAEGQQKACSKCALALPLSAFGKQRSSPDGLRYECRDCQRAYMATYRVHRRQYFRDSSARRWNQMDDEEKARKRSLDNARYHANREKARSSYVSRNYGISEERYAEMLEAQDSRCAICRGTSTRRLAIDHDHACCPGSRSCGKCVRALLCDACNNGLGRFRDDPELLLRAAQYLESYSSPRLLPVVASINRKVS